MRECAGILPTAAFLLPTTHYLLPTKAPHREQPG